MWKISDFLNSFKSFNYCFHIFLFNDLVLELRVVESSHGVMAFCDFHFLVFIFYLLRGGTLPYKNTLCGRKGS